MIIASPSSHWHNLFSAWCWLVEEVAPLCCSAIVARFVKIPDNSSEIDVNLFCYVRHLATSVIPLTSLSKEKGPIRGPWLMCARCCGFLSFSGDLHNHSINCKKGIPRFSEVLRYVYLQNDLQYSFFGIQTDPRFFCFVHTMIRQLHLQSETKISINKDINRYRLE